METVPSQETLSTLLSYNPDTGVMKAIRPIARGPVGRRAYIGDTGSLEWRVGKSYELFQEERLAWMIVTGADPGEEIIEHIDGDKLNNKFANLRFYVEPVEIEDDLQEI